MKRLISRLVVSGIVLMVACGGDDTDGNGGGTGGSSGTHGTNGTSGVSGAAGTSAAGCHQNTDCDGGKTCARVEEPTCGGVAPPMDCADDGDCTPSGADRICETTSCGGHVCIARCAGDQSCPSNPAGALACDTSTGRCHAKPCEKTQDCPANYLCSVDSECNPRPCLDDSVCDGFCVHSVCSASAGVCRDVVP